ncbi:MAG TPA: hypothetical protein VGG06_11135 [Thermoanaerobaculia bacterium]|jgi:hypothetical protein
MQANHRRRLIPLTATLALILLAPTGSALAAPGGNSQDAKVRAADSSKIALARHERGNRRGDRRDRVDRRHDRRHRVERRHDRRQHDRRHFDRGYRSHGQYRGHGHYRQIRPQRHFTIPRQIHHDHYRDYYYDRVYYPDHRHHHVIYRFPVFVDGYWDYRPYAYCGDRYFATGYFAVDGPRFSLRIGF